MKSTVVTKEPVKTMFIKAEGGVAGAKQAFAKLESHFPSLRGRRFYGILTADGEYLACTRIEASDNPRALNLLTFGIPGGKYATCKVTDWNNKLQQIGPVFVDMAKEHEADPSRPSVEFYRSLKELILMLPIK